MLQSLVRRGSPGLVGGASKVNPSMIARPNAGLGDDFWKWLVEKGSSVVNGIGDAMTSLGNQVPQIDPEISSRRVGNWWGQAGNAIHCGLNDVGNFFGRMAPRNMR
jgi:hypothetical protein